MDKAEFLAKAMTVPFEEKGRSWDGWDCYGLLYRALVDVLNLAPPDYLDEYKTVRDLALLGRVIGRQKQSWQPIKQSSVRWGDGVLLWPREGYCHIGLMIDRVRFLHIEEQSTAFLDRLTSPMWREYNSSRSKIEGFYRFQ